MRSAVATWRAVVVGLLLGSLVPLGLGAQEAPEAARPIALVHLPALPVETANRAAEAVNALTDALAAGVPGLSVDVQLFRRLEDARALYATDPARIAFILAEPAFLKSLPDAGRFEPRYRFRRGGEENYHRLLVVLRDRPELATLEDLAGKTLSFVEIAGSTPESHGAYLGEALLPGTIVTAAGGAATTFFQLSAVQDDFTAAANVVFRQSDAALVAEHNPLLQSHLGELRILHTSPPLSLPVLAIARGALTEAQLQALDDTAVRLRPGAGNASREALAELKLEGLALIPPAERIALLHGQSPTVRRPEIALPDAGALSPVALPPVDPATLSFALTVELPEVPILQGDPASPP
jgi:ABC-type phosphate/phosphonate transport system substrate-binding protein